MMIWRWIPYLGFVLVIVGTIITLVGLFIFSASIAILGLPTYFWIIVGLIMIAVGGIILNTIVGNDKDFLSELEIFKNNLKQNGEAIRVEFSKCEIKTNDYSVEREKNYTDDVQFWNALQDERRNTEIVDVYQSVIVFKYEHDGITETFNSDLIAKEREHLLFILDSKKETMLYIDKNNRNIYFFDLDFIDKRLI